MSITDSGSTKVPSMMKMLSWLEKDMLTISEPLKEERSKLATDKLCLRINITTITHRKQKTPSGNSAE